MNQTQLALVIGGATIVVMGCKLRNRNKKLKEYHDHIRKLQDWTKTAQRLMKETIDNNPDLNLDVSEDLAVELHFYNIMERENLL
jgi:hypothetical protein